jgi:hypothetical protein
MLLLISLIFIRYHERVISMCICNHQFVYRIRIGLLVQIIHLYHIITINLFIISQLIVDISINF